MGMLKFGPSPTCKHSTFFAPRLDLSAFLKAAKSSDPSKRIFVKYDIAINLCEFTTSKYFGDILTYKYAGLKHGEFGYGFPECFEGRLEDDYKVYLISGFRSLPVKDLPRF